MEADMERKRMPHGTDTELSSWLDRRVLDRHGDVFGVVVDVYVDAFTRRPAWLAISTGMFGTNVTVAPVRGSSLLGDDVVVAHSKQVVTTAPAALPHPTLDPVAELAVSHHYMPRKQAGERRR